MIQPIIESNKQALLQERRLLSLVLEENIFISDRFSEKSFEMMIVLLYLNNKVVPSDRYIGKTLAALLYGFMLSVIFTINLLLCVLITHH